MPCELFKKRNKSNHILRYREYSNLDLSNFSIYGRGVVDKATNPDACAKKMGGGVMSQESEGFEGEIW